MKKIETIILHLEGQENGSLEVSVASSKGGKPAHVFVASTESELVELKRAINEACDACLVERLKTPVVKEVKRPVKGKTEVKAIHDELEEALFDSLLKAERKDLLRLRTLIESALDVS